MGEGTGVPLGQLDESATVEQERGGAVGDSTEGVEGGADPGIGGNGGPPWQPGGRAEADPGALPDSDDGSVEDRVVGWVGSEPAPEREPVSPSQEHSADVRADGEPGAGGDLDQESSELELVHRPGESAPATGVDAAGHEPVAPQPNQPADADTADGPTTPEAASQEPVPAGLAPAGLASEESEQGADDPAAAGKTGGSRLQQLEREGEVAADFLEKLLDIADLDGDIDVDVDGDRAAVAIVDSDEGRVPRRLVGPDGRVLEALQELTRLAVQTATGERSRLMLDVGGFRAERRSALVNLARSAIAEVKESGRQKALADMTAFERKVVHDEVTAAGLVSESEGIEPHRHIVILPG